MNKDEFLSEYAVDRRNTCCVKWDDLKESFGEDGLLPFWIADTEFIKSGFVSVRASFSQSAHLCKF